MSHINSNDVRREADEVLRALKMEHLPVSQSATQLQYNDDVFRITLSTSAIQEGQVIIALYFAAYEPPYKMPTWDLVSVSYCKGLANARAMFYYIIAGLLVESDMLPVEEGEIA